MEKVTSNGTRELLPITLVPSDTEDFKRAFMQREEATIYVTYSGERVEPKTWARDKFKESSGVMHNLRSRPEFRQGEWQRLGIKKVEVKVSGY